MAAKSWDKDFRYKAIQESIKIVRSERPGDLFDCPRSFCVPLAEKPVVGWTPGKLFIIFLVMGFVFLIGAAVIVGIAEQDTNRPPLLRSFLLIAGTVMGFAGMGCFFVPATMDRLIMRLLLGSRGSDLTHQPGELLCAEISNTDRAEMAKLSIDGDDHVLILADQENRRLLMEGVAARYQIRAEDVVNLRPFQFMNYVGAEITYRIGDHLTLSLAIARVSLLLELTRQVPLLFFLQKRIKNRIYQACEQTLQRPLDDIRDEEFFS